jgi:hypothetical protein
MHTKYVFVGYQIVFEMHRLISGLKNKAAGQLFFSATYSELSSSLLCLRFPKLYLAFKFILSKIQNTATGQRIFSSACLEPSPSVHLLPKALPCVQISSLKASEG